MSLVISAGTVELIGLLVDLGVSAATITQSINELNGKSEVEIAAIMGEVEAAREIERRRRASHTGE
jgi:uncharacterized protein (DUF111 family)